MNKLKVKRLLGLAVRSRNVAIGESTCLNSIKQNKAKIVFIASDASENTEKRLTDKCNYRNIPICRIYDRYELGEIIGRDFSVCIAVTDDNFYNGIIEHLGGKAIGKEESIHNC